MPIPIQMGSITDRMRRFFRVRGRSGFALDEIVAPVALIQDLTKGPYQAGVTPLAGAQQLNMTGTNTGSLAVLINDKPGSPTLKLGPQFKDRSFSVTWVEIQNLSATLDFDDLRLQLVPRSLLIAAGPPTAANSLYSIQNNDGSLKGSVELMAFDAVALTGAIIWRGRLGNNLNTLGSLRTFEPEPNVTIGPDDVLALVNPTAVPGAASIQLSIRGFYQQQPA